MGSRPPVPQWRDEREEASQHDLDAPVKAELRRQDPPELPSLNGSSTAGMLRHELGGEHQDSVSVTVVVAP